LTRQVREKCLEGIFGEIKPFAKSLGIKLALENLSYTSTGFGKNVEQLEEVLAVIDPEGEMGITFDLCHALETDEMDSLLEKYGRRVCNVHMADKNHQPFLETTPGLERFLRGLHKCGYGGPITLELAHGTRVTEILKTKALLNKMLPSY
jgi:sugar phosphate isomerase/epimerase